MAKIGDRMEVMTLAKKKTYPCIPATTQEISYQIIEASNVSSNQIDNLRKCTYQIEATQIPWSCIHHIGLIGDTVCSCNLVLGEFGLIPGVYTNHDGDWLILIHPADAEIQKYVDYCAAALFSLTICNTGISSLGLSQLKKLAVLNISECNNFVQFPKLDGMTHLAELQIFSCNGLAKLPTLDSLVHLRCLSLSGCPCLVELPSLHNQKWLSKLLISDCDSLIQLPLLDKLTKLGTLYLNNCNSLTQLPSLDNLILLTDIYL